MQHLKEKTYPAPDTDPGPIDVSPFGHFSRRSHLILHLVIAQVVGNWVAEIASSITRPATVNDDGNVLFLAGEVRLPVPLITVRNELRAWSAVSVPWSANPLSFPSVRPIKQEGEILTYTLNRTGYFLRPEVSILGGKISSMFISDLISLCRCSGTVIAYRYRPRW